MNVYNSVLLFILLLFPRFVQAAILHDIWSFLLSIPFFMLYLPVYLLCLFPYMHNSFICDVIDDGDDDYDCRRMCNSCNNGYCSNFCKDGCICYDGWEGTYCEVDIDECMLGIDNCDNTTEICINLASYSDQDPLYRCDCASGYILVDNLCSISGNNNTTIPYDDNNTTAFTP